MVVYSFSQLGLYQQCPKKYQFRYLDGLEKSFETTPDLLLGTSVHSSLERFYQQLNIYKKPQKSDLVEYFDIQRSKSLQENWEKIVMKWDQTLDDYQRRGQHYLSFLDDINMKQGLIYVKQFYIVVPYYVGEMDADQVKKPWRSKFMDALNAKDDVESVVSRYRNFVKGQKMINTRIALVQEGLWSLGIQTQQLSTKEVISLLFSMYNPLLDSTQSQVIF